ncbi:uncharacterized protein [Physcomitrium patens]|nr:paramyosin-like isoform X2 [Physcomitrium patens]XP_024381297.1 paramyosin-like isoform X2 [Physcomitrium patens]|eukprot:XP_024381296.1 paramyosin-like isoform X2 [Physcomitrella patens]
MQARRAANLEQELETYKEKTSLLTRENHGLQQELSEAYRLKTQITEAFKRAVEKNNQVEKDVKFYQSKVATAFAERDKALVEVERVKEVEKEMIAEVQQLNSRAEEAEKQLKEEEEQKLKLQHDYEVRTEQLDILHKVVDKFWELRGNVPVALDDGQPQDLQPLDKAQALILESDVQWTYGGSIQAAVEALQQELKVARTLAEENDILAKKEQARTNELDAQLALLQQEVKAAQAFAEERGLLAKEEQSRANDLDEQLKKLKEEVEATAHSLSEQAAGEASTYKVHMEKLQKFIVSKLFEIQNDHGDVRTRVDSLLKDEKQWIDSMVDKFEALLLELKARDVHPEIVDKYEERSPPQEEAPLPAAESAKPYVFKEAQTSNGLDELERTTVSLLNEHTPESVDNENLPSLDVSSVVASSLQAESEIIAGTHPVVENNNRIREEEPCSAVVSLSRSVTDMIQEDRKALAQALHEKVEALLLLSQQEERYYMESKTIQGLEFQIKDLNEKISQVTSEKVSALMEVAQLRQDCHRLEEREKELIRRLQQHRSTSAGGRLLPASWSEPNASQTRQEKPHAVTENQLQSYNIVPKPSLSTSGYLKSWLRGIDMSGPGGLRALSEPSKQSKSPATDEPADLAKLRVENAALQERVAGVQRLTASAHRLRMTLVKVSADSETEPSVASLNSFLKVVDGVKSEASHLRVALGCSLPVSVTPESPPQQSDADEGMSKTSVGEVHAAVDVATGAGIEMVELLLVACELQKGAIQGQINIVASQCEVPDGE